MMDFKEQLTEISKYAEAVINEYLPKSEGYQKTVMDVMNYGVTTGGKRLRPVIMYKTYCAFGGKEKIVRPFMSALEMIHSYSLIHDDLPEMDNDELRRGKPTAHIKFGQAMAVLGGDALLNYAFEIMLKAAEESEEKDFRKCIRAARVLSDKAGIYGMIGGQTVDVEAEKKQLKLDKEQILFTYENKTAALLQSAFMIGAILAGADDEKINALEEVGYKMGIAFQLQDDILDVTGNQEVFGKPIGSDEEKGKVTYLSYLGLDKAIEMQKQLSTEAVDILKNIETVNEEDRQFLIKLVEHLVTRNI